MFLNIKLNVLFTWFKIQHPEHKYVQCFLVLPLLLGHTGKKNEMETIEERCKVNSFITFVAVQ